MAAGPCPGYDQSQVLPEPALSDGMGGMADIEWHLGTGHGFCGGCGLDSCHPDRCCTQEKDLMGIMDSVCGLCPERVNTGQRREVTP